jgi:hypothetical protein
VESLLDVSDYCISVPFCIFCSYLSFTLYWSENFCSLILSYYKIHISDKSEALVYQSLLFMMG